MKLTIEEYLDPLKLPIFNVARQQYSLLNDCTDSFIQNCSFKESDLPQLSTDLIYERDLTSGILLSKPVDICYKMNSSRSSTGLRRKPEGSTTSGVEFSSFASSLRISGDAKLSLPFQPAGFGTINFASDPNKSDNSLLTCPKGLPNGVPHPDKEKATFKIAPDETKIESVLTSLVSDDTTDLNPSDANINDKKISVMPISVKFVEKPVKPKFLRSNPPKSGPKFAIPVNISQPVTNFDLLIPNPAIKYEFELDTFQKQAILCLERGESVLVAAQTSAGKTVVAEYAIAMCMRNGSKAVYTSPIKALSNQKFRDFKKVFSEVGLITGDVQINMTASCLIMTTEILRSMLYSGSESIRDLEWVIFDEVHYINDVDRGVVWEEVLIMLPAHVGVILLSATVPNTLEFAQWIGNIKKRNIYVIATLKRPVPLEHYLYTGSSRANIEDLYMIVSGNREFSIPGYRQAVQSKESSKEPPPTKGGRGDAQNRGGGRGGSNQAQQDRRAKKAASHSGPAGQTNKFFSGAGGGASQQSRRDKTFLLGVIEMLKVKEKLPAVVFTFSKAKIQYNVSQLNSVDLLSKDEKNAARSFFKKAVSCLRADDREIPQLQQLEDMICRGFAIHHSGVLPILKEIVEILFQKGLLKILFTTETFAMGVNMPARTVLFDALEKYDGNRKRWLLPGEYTQMAGRAGRRGLDSMGTVIILVKGDTVPTQVDLQRIILGQATRLESQFKLTYTMILNLHRVESFKIQDMMRRSFIEANEMNLHETNVTRFKEISHFLETSGNLDCYRCSKDIDAYYQNCQRISSLKADLISTIANHPHCARLLCTGRLVLLRSGVIPGEDHCRVPGLIVEHSKEGQTVRLNILVMKRALSDKRLTSQSMKLIQDQESQPNCVYKPRSEPILKMGTSTNLECALYSLKLDDVDRICSLTVPKLNSADILSDFGGKKGPSTLCKFVKDIDHTSKSLETSQKELRKLLSGGNVDDDFTYAAIEKELQIKVSYEIDKINELMELESNIEALYPSCLACPHFGVHFQTVHHKYKLLQELAELRHRLSDDNLSLLPEYNQRVELLKYLGYLSQRGAIRLKGRAACEIGVHEIVITELITQGLLVKLEPAAIAAILSPFVFDQTSRDSTPNNWIKEMPSVLQGPCKELLKIANEVESLERAYGLQSIGDTRSSQLELGLVTVVYEWAQQKSFIQIMRMTEIQEGIIVRCIQRLDELLRHLRIVCRLFQAEPRLEQKALEASQLIRRDVVFAASLYFTVS